MSDSGDKINYVNAVSGTDINITQIYAPGQAGIRKEVFAKVAGSKPFSIDWLFFAEECVPFFGRNSELAEIEHFLADSRSFAWWAVVGHGGTGKSRLALESVQRLPPGWDGGFIPKEDISARAAAAWQPTTNTLWIVDYAGKSHLQIREMIATFSRISHATKFKVRLLLLDRSFSPTTGWWAELTGSIGREKAAINYSMYSEPLTLPPFANSTRQFLDNVLAILPSDLADTLRNSMASMTDSWLSERSDQGNPLILLLLASELVSSQSTLPENPFSDVQDIVESYIGRELRMLRDHCDKTGLQFSRALDLLFVTTSVYPLTYAEKTDLVILADKDGKIALIKGDSTKWRIPTFEEFGQHGLDILDEKNQVTLQNLSKITGIDDVESYFALLDEAGFSRSRRWAVQPDLLGETLVRLVVNSPAVSKSLKQLRGEYHQEGISALLEGALALDQENCWTNWARLDDEALVVLTGHLRTSGKSIRLMLVTIRMLNHLRDAKLPFDSKQVFGQSVNNKQSTDIGRYFDEVRALLSHDLIDDETVGEIAGSEHAWLLPYFEFLLNLTATEKLSVARFICRIDTTRILERLTNTSNFASVLLVYLRSIISDRSRDLWLDKVESLGAFVDGTIDFLRTRAFPVLAVSEEDEFKDPFRNIAQALIVCSYGILNERFGRAETTESRTRARDALDVAIAALEFAPNAADLADAERNRAALNMTDAKNDLDAAALYITTLRRMEGYASPSDYTSTILDMMNFAGRRRSLHILKEGINHVRVGLQNQLIVGEMLATAFIDIMLNLINDNHEADDLTEAYISICGTLQLSLFSTHHVAAADAFSQILAQTILCSVGTRNARDEIIQLFVQAQELIEENECSELFIESILSAAAACRLAWNGDITALPFDTRTSSLSDEELARARTGVSEDEFRRDVKEILKVEVYYAADSGESWSHITYFVTPNDDLKNGDSAISSGTRRTLNQIETNLGSGKQL